jgi:hypothetical protein
MYLDPKSKRQEYEMLRAQLDNERTSFISHWRDIGDYLLPRRPRFNTWETNRGDKKNQKIIDSTAMMALGTLRSGMMSGITSPARPWFRLTTPDPALAEFGPVKQWLHDVQERMSTAFLRSNLYNALPLIYGDMGAFGTAAMLMEEDFDDVVRFYPFPIGSYWIANNEKLQVNIFMREFRMTVRQLVDRFGRKDSKGKPDWSIFSTHVRNLYERSQYEAWIEVRHVIQPNKEYNPSLFHNKYKKFSSCYYESGTMQGTNANYMGSDENKFLRESGYDYFPVLCPRWELYGEDVYGSDCPGMRSLGDNKALQILQKRHMQAIEKMVNPPMVAPPSMKNVKTSILPGDITYADERDGQKGFRPAHEVNPRLQEMLLSIQDHQERIRRSFFEDLFLMLAQSDRRQITAREIDERREEKLLALGPVLEQLNQDLLDPLIDNAFNIMVEQNQIPKPPEELQGMPLKVEYISIMAQAQKLIGISTAERFTGFVAQLSAVNPEVLDKVDFDQLVDVYGDMTSIAPGIIRPDEDVNEIRAQRAQAQQAAAQAEQLKLVAGGAKELSQTTMEGDNALTRIIDEANAGNLVQ